MTTRVSCVLVVLWRPDGAGERQDTLIQRALAARYMYIYMICIILYVYNLIFRFSLTANK